MRDVSLRLEAVSKRYRVGELNAHRTLREAVTDAAVRPFRTLGHRLRHGRRESNEATTFWALQDVTFDMAEGEILGIVGRNGAGKSTLLKILSRITEPTQGRIEVYGRVGSLLEVGTGFHPELTGRENIYLNGAILGMSRSEISRKFDEIVAFSEIERFLETPVKRYSSGMYVRLAYAVAAHLEPEILLVDEVLAVGDVDFQKKCIGSMKSVARSGRTVVIVSHNMALIEALCTRAIWLSDGRVRADGAVHETVTQYLSATRLQQSGNLLEHPRSVPKTGSMVTGIELITSDGVEGHDVKMGSGLAVRVSVAAGERIARPWIGVQIRTSYDQLVYHCANRESGYELPALHGDCVVTCHIEQLNLLPDRYFIDILLADMSNTVYDEVAGAAWFDVRAADVFSTGMPMEKDYGLVYFPSRWELSTVPETQQAKHGSA